MKIIFSSLFSAAARSISVNTAHLFSRVPCATLKASTTMKCVYQAKLCVFLESKSARERKAYFFCNKCDDYDTVEDDGGMISK